MKHLRCFLFNFIYYYDNGTANAVFTVLVMLQLWKSARTSIIVENNNTPPFKLRRSFIRACTNQKHTFRHKLHQIFLEIQDTHPQMFFFYGVLPGS